MDTTQRQVMKAEHPEEDEESAAGWYVAAAVPFLFGGIFFLFQDVDAVGKFAGALLALVGLAIIIAAVWVRAGR